MRIRLSLTLTITLTLLTLPTLLTIILDTVVNKAPTKADDRRPIKSADFIGRFYRPIDFCITHDRQCRIKLLGGPVPNANVGPCHLSLQSLSLPYP